MPVVPHGDGAAYENSTLTKPQAGCWVVEEAAAEAAVDPEFH